MHKLTTSRIDRILDSRRKLYDDAVLHPNNSREEAAEGGCGVVGVTSSFPVAGRHFFPAAEQMHNRGNGKGGGIAAAGLNPAQMGVSANVLRDATMLQVAYLDADCVAEVEAECIFPVYDVLTSYRVDTVEDYREIEGLEIQPPDVVRYFVRAKKDVLVDFAKENALEDLTARELEDEFVYRNSFLLNTKFYASLGEQRAFVMSHGRDLLIFKIVGYAEEAAKYYKLDEMEAHVWIAHQRYPTKGRVWHPGGAHPFIGMNEALVHNGDFANYHAVSDYLKQRNIKPLFLTDTEISVLLFDLLDRTYHYPLEAIVEALAPTTERDFLKLPAEKQSLYRQIQKTHIHASPDGPWFFIIARSQPEKDLCQLLGITDTSMLRPQVFALVDSEMDGKRYQMGLLGSEKQAIDATLKSLSKEYAAIPTVADRYWNARGGSYNDGGSFTFSVRKKSPDAHYGSMRELVCRNKFGEVIEAPKGQAHWNPTGEEQLVDDGFAETMLEKVLAGGDDSFEAMTAPVQKDLCKWISNYSYEAIAGAVDAWVKAGADVAKTKAVLALLTRLRDSMFDPQEKRRASILDIMDAGINALLDGVPAFDAKAKLSRITWETRDALQAPTHADAILVMDVIGFPAEGDEGPGIFHANAFRMGWHHLVSYRWAGQRFLGCNLSKVTDALRFDVYGSPGDYFASGMDGDEVAMMIHTNAQDQLAQIFNHGTLVIYGDVGQTFMYGAKGGKAFVRGNVAGRPLINAVGAPRVVINGTCLDYLAESFMAGDPLNGGGFVILNGIEFDDRGQMVALDEPYRGNNLFSLASGGALYVRDPYAKLDENQLNGGMFADLSEADWDLILPYLEENEAYFGIDVDALLTVDGKVMAPEKVYRKICPK